MVNPFEEFDEKLLEDSQKELAYYVSLMEKYKDSQYLRESLREIIIYIDDSIKEIGRMTNDTRERFRGFIQL